MTNELNKSETPRTDRHLISKYTDGSGNRLPYVGAEFARLLEKELTAAKAEIEQLKSSRDSLRELVKEFINELEAAQKRFRRQHGLTFDEIPNIVTPYDGFITRAKAAIEKEDL